MLLADHPESNFTAACDAEEKDRGAFMTCTDTGVRIRFVRQTKRIEFSRTKLETFYDAMAADLKPDDETLAQMALDANEEVKRDNLQRVELQNLFDAIQKVAETPEQAVEMFNAIVKTNGYVSFPILRPSLACRIEG